MQSFEVIAYECWISKRFATNTLLSSCFLTKLFLEFFSENIVFKSVFSWDKIVSSQAKNENLWMWGICKDGFSLEDRYIRKPDICQSTTLVNATQTKPDNILSIANFDRSYTVFLSSSKT